MSIKHGRNCEKVPHVQTGYLHGEDDDREFLVDGVLYCGRCHKFYIPDIDCDVLVRRSDETVAEFIDRCSNDTEDEDMPEDEKEDE